MEPQSIFIIAPSGATDPVLARLADQAASAGCAPLLVEHAKASASLKESMRSNRGPSLILLAPSIDQPIATARELRSLWQAGHLIFVRQPGQMEALRRELSRAMLIGSEWSLVQADDPALPEIIREVARTAARRKRLRTTLDRANLQIAAHKPIDSIDYRRLLLSEHYLASILAQANDAIIGLDADLNILHWNKGAEHLFGLDAKSALARKADQMPWWCDAVSMGIRALQAGQSAQNTETSLVRNGETLILDITFSSVLDERGSFLGTSLIIRDVTRQRRHAEAERANLEKLVAERTAELRRSELALHQSQKLEAVGKLTGGVAHDFNNILQVIGGNLELLSIMLASEPAALKRIHNAIAATERGAKLSSHLLSFARRQPLQPLPTNLGRVLREIDDLLRRALGEGIEIETIIGGGLWNTMVDRNQMENVILNLAINARDAMEGAGKLTLELGNAMLDDQYAQQHGDVAPGQYVVLAVSDTGCGMDPATLERAFEPFFTTKPDGQGTGLGLSMTYGFVKQSSGHIKIYSEPGHGTTIRIYLPRSHQAELQVTDTRSSPATGGSETILVVEDDLAVQTAVVDMLVDMGYRVLKAPDALSALTILQSGMPVDLLFTDVVMPGAVRSPELARQARILLPNIKVLFTSGYTQNAIVHGGRLDPGVELLSKPYRREDLARKVRHVLDLQ